MYSTNHVVFNAVNFIRDSLFSYKKEKHFDIESSDPDLRRFFGDLLLGYRPRVRYGQAYDLEGFLRTALVSLVIFGRCFYKIDWIESDHDQGGKRFVVDKIRWLAVETMEVIKTNGQIQGFKQEYSSHIDNEDVKGASFEFKQDEIFFIEWVFDRNEKRGVAPLRRLVRFSKQMHRGFESMNLYAKAMYHPEDHSFAVERARYTPWEEIRTKIDQSQLKIQGLLGSIPNAPMTEYYETYQFVKCRKMMARIREYLLSEFNAQIVDRIAEKNGITKAPQIKLVNYKSAMEIDELFNSFERREIPGKKAMEILREEMI